MAEEMVVGWQTSTCIRTHRQKRPSNGLGGKLGAHWGNCWGCLTVSPYQFLRAEADEDPLGVFAVMSALHEGQEELGGIVLARRNPC